MKKSLIRNTLLSLAVAAAVPAVQAAQVDVTWNNPEKFRDIEAANTAQANYQDRVLTELEDHFRKAGERLPEGQTLSVTINDVDLAGYVEYMHPNYPFGVRLIRNIDFPRIHLDYELRDANGEIINSGTGKLADLGFRFPTFATRNLNELDYEKRMIERWVSKNFS